MCVEARRRADALCVGVCVGRSSSSCLFACLFVSFFVVSFFFFCAWFSWFSVAWRRFVGVCFFHSCCRLKSRTIPSFLRTPRLLLRPFFVALLLLSVASCARAVNMFSMRKAVVRAASRAAAAFFPRLGWMPPQALPGAPNLATVSGSRAPSFAFGRRRLRQLSTLPDNGKAVTEDPTLSAANTALDDAKVALAQAKQERDAAKQEWQEASGSDRDLFRGVFLDAQSAVTDAQSTVNKLLLAAAGNGSNGSNGSNSSHKLPADDATVVKLTTMWQTLRETDIKPHTTVFPDVEVLDEYGVPFDFNVLEVPGPLPFAAVRTTTSTVVERDFYPLLKDIANKHAGSPYRVLLRGAPGIGKSGALGAYLLHAMGQRMNEDGEQCPIQQVVLTSPQDRCYVYRRDGTVDVWETFTPEVSHLALQADTVWLMDEKEHGPFLGAEGLTFLIASADPENYDTFWKKSQRLCFIPTWDSDGRLSDQGLPLELEALVRVMMADQTSDVTVPEAVEYYKVCGALPRDIVEDPGRAEKQITRIVRQLSMEDVQKFTAKHADLIDAHLNHRLANPYVDRATLDEDDATLVIVSDYVRQLLLAKQTAGDWEQTLAVYKTQAQISGSRAGVGKMFEELAFHYLTHVDGEVTARRMDSDDDDDEVEKLRVCPEGADVGTVTTFKQDLRGRQPYMLKSDNATEGGLDFLCATDEGDLTAINVTLNRNHDMKPREIAQRLEAQHPRDTTTVRFVWLTDEVTAPHMKQRDLADTLSDKDKEKTRNELLCRVEQWVAELPVDFADFIKYDQARSAPQMTLKTEDETK